MTKLTYIGAINEAINGNVTDEVREKLEALIVSLEKRNKKTGDRKPTKAQRENEALKAEIAEYLRHTLQGMQCKDVAAQFGISGQKCSALLNQLVDSAILEKFTEKRVTYFKAVDVDEPQYLDDEVSV